MIAIGKILGVGASGELELELFDADMSSFRVGKNIKVNTIRKLTDEQESMAKLRGLWYLLLRELKEQTGYSVGYWKGKLKRRGGFFTSVVEPDGKITRDFRSVAAGECTFEQLSDLVRESIVWIKEDEVIDLGAFEARYFEITGRELLSA